MDIELWKHTKEGQTLQEQWGAGTGLMLVYGTPGTTSFLSSPTGCMGEAGQYGWNMTDSELVCFMVVHYSHKHTMAISLGSKCI